MLEKYISKLKNINLINKLYFLLNKFIIHLNMFKYINCNYLNHLFNFINILFY